MSKITTEELFREHQKAVEYIQKIGAPQRHFGPDSKGRLNSLEIKTQIAHQQHTGDTNYWQHNRFDLALAEVIRKHFDALSKETLSVMLDEAKRSMVAEEDGLRLRLAEIEELKSSLANAEKIDAEQE